ncbi:hypothetical protein CRENBAI_014767, partial [Crenichthys baileyi]
VPGLNPLTGNSPQRADEAVHGSLCIQRHDISNVEETGGRVGHPAAALDSSSSGEDPAGGAGERAPCAGRPASADPLSVDQGSPENRSSKLSSWRAGTKYLHTEAASALLLLGPTAGFCMKTKLECFHGGADGYAAGQLVPPSVCKGQDSPATATRK